MKQIAVAIHSLRSNLSFSFGEKIPVAINRSIVILVILALFIAEALRVYLVMPYPGSQQRDTVEIAHWVSTHMLWIRLIAFIVISVALIRVFKRGKRWEKIILPLVLVGYIPVFFVFNYKLDAENIFHRPSYKSFIPVSQSEEKNKLAIGIVINGEAKAYPIQLIGYHHQVIDTVGNEPVIITYCTVCRTGRAYSTLVEGKHESFRLVGMDHFNAVFEDESTKSWWQQATGKAIAGPLKGSVLKEIPSHQMTINSWMRQYPHSMLMAPDSLYEERYFGLDNYDRGTMQSPLVKRDYEAWHPKSWIVGVKNEFSSIAYDWNDLVKKRVIQDSLRTLPILLTLESDTVSFHVYDRRLNNQVLQFDTSVTDNNLTDLTTNSTWNMDGVCISGVLKGQRLATVQGYNEFWHSWQTFQENVKRHVPTQ